MITRTFKLCLNAGTGSAPYINVSQYDEGETWLFELYSETGERYIPTTGAIVGVKSDGHGIVNTGTVDSEGRVVITETQQMTASAGRAIFELSIDGLTHGTANFIVAVERKPTDNADLSDSDLSLIQEAIDSAEVIVEVIGDGDPSEVIGEHVDAWLDNHPEATTTVQDGAITAPKINSTLWDKLLVSEEASGAVASFDDGADDVPVSSLKVALEPIQTGTGDPSPSNVRPIIAANGKNLLQITATSQTVNGVTFTVNADGTVKANGTASSAAEIIIKSDVSGNTYAGMILSGCPNGGGGSTYRLFEQVQGSPWTYLASDGGVGVTLPTTTYATVRFVIRIESGISVNNLVFKPMIRPASITDPSFQPYQGIMVERTGKNLFDASTITPNKALSSNGALVNSTASFVSDFIPVKETVYVFYNYETLAATANRVIGFYDASKEWMANKSISYAPTSTYHEFTVPEGAVYARISMDKNCSDVNVSDTGTSYPYSLGQSVYGGTVDLATGVLTVTHGFYTFTGNEAWNASSTAHRFSVSMIYYLTYPAAVQPMVTGASQNALTSVFGECVYKNADGVAYLANQGTNMIFVVNEQTATTVDDIKGITTGMQLCYELAEPQTIQLTPTQVKTLLGYNNISSSGTVDVIYHADTKLYVDKMTAVDNNIIAPTEETFTATRNYTVNDLVIVNDTLYKVTANIASGSTITPNSNVTATTLSTLIKALS